MPIEVNGNTFDTMKEACDRLNISRQTMLNYIQKGIFREPQKQKQGRAKYVRYFTEDWYVHSEQAMNNTEIIEKNDLDKEQNGLESADSLPDANNFIVVSESEIALDTEHEDDEASKD